MESLVGAIYAGDRCSMKGVEIFFAKILAPFYEAHINLESLSYHPAKMLSETMQQKGCRNLDTRKGGVHQGAYCVGEGLPSVSHEPKTQTIHSCGARNGAR
jgi:hypothetical protein